MLRPWSPRLLLNEKLRLPALALMLITALGSPIAAQNGRIVFMSQQSGSWQLYTMNPDGTNRMQITHLRTTDLDSWAPAISPDGQRVAFNYGTGSSTGGAFNADLYVVNIDGTNLTRLTYNGLSLAPRWSPDGTRLIFSKISKRSNAGVVTIMQADGTGPEIALTNDLWDNFGGSYTPDGKQIVFYSEEGGFIAAVWIMDADGSNKQRLTEAALEAFPYDVSPDGQHILLENHQNSPAALANDLFVMSLDGTGLTQLTQLRKLHHDTGATYSPDGRMIAFQSDRLEKVPPNSIGALDIFTMKADGTNITRIAKDVGSCGDDNCIDPYWGPNP